MSEMTYQDLEKQFYTLYGAKAYGQALDLLERERTHFSDYPAEMYYNWVCVAALANQTSRALQVFKEALDLGYWFAPEWAMRDTDLVTLRDLPTFKEYLEICAQRLAVAQASARPELLVMQPEQQTPASPLLLHLHGNGGNAQNTSKHCAEITKRGWMLALPQSSQMLGPGAYMWNDREKGAKEVREHLLTLTREYAIDANRIVLSGFSMGGSQAILMALQGEIKTSGFVVLGPYFHETELEGLPDLLAKSKLSNLRGSILIGENDTECLEGTRKAVEIMHAHNIACELEILPGLGHSYPPDFAAHLAKGLAFVEQTRAAK